MIIPAIYRTETGEQIQTEEREIEAREKADKCI
jgi:hypothetical protein